MLLYPTVEVLSKICSFRNCKNYSLLCRDLGKKLSLFPVLCCADMKNLFKKSSKCRNIFNIILLYKSDIKR